MYSPAGYLSILLCGVTHKLAVANFPFNETADVGAVSTVGPAEPFVKGINLYAVAFPLTGFVFPSAFEIFHDRALAAS